MALWFVMLLLAEGLIVGVLARLVLPGPDPMSVPGTVALGLAGSFLGGVIAWLFIGYPMGLVFSVIGATALLYTRRRFLEHR
ncbi:MAG TPA: GlsB/YeaQ/YmgE family stress response membrane protein [Gaiellaceae bacterium]|nr:GlsB/YeaQ/YmgE family stress response membrane protein [Gaiellaceae bacterium]